MNLVREAAKKISYFPYGRAIRKEGGGGPAIKEQNNFLKLFWKILLPFKIKNYFTLDNPPLHILISEYASVKDALNFWIV